MKITKTLTVLAALALVAFVAAPVAQAVCPTNYDVTWFPSPTEYSYIYTPSISCDGPFPTPCPQNGSVTADARGSFWIIGDGDPAVGLGNDNGSLEFVQSEVYPFYPLLPQTDWAQPGVDGCSLTATPAGERCIAVLLTDQDADGNGYYLLQTRAANLNQNYEMNQPGNASLFLAPIARPAITGSTRIDDSNVSLTLGAPDLGGGLVLDPLCNDPVAGYRILAQAVASGAAPPTSRDVAEWTDLSGAVVPPSSGTTVQVTCTGDQDVYLTTALEFDSQFQTTFVSVNSSRVECGPNLADPVAPRPRLRPGGSIDMRERSGKGGR